MNTSDTATPDSTAGGSRIANRVDRARAGADDVINKASEVTHPAVDRISSGAHYTVDKAAGTATRAAAMFSEKREKLRYAQARTMEQTRSYVRANPITSVGIAVAAGYFLSRLLRSRKA